MSINLYSHKINKACEDTDKCQGQWVSNSSPSGSKAAGSLHPYRDATLTLFIVVICYLTSFERFYYIHVDFSLTLTDIICAALKLLAYQDTSNYYSQNQYINHL